MWEGRRKVPAGQGKAKWHTAGKSRKGSKFQCSLGQAGDTPGWARTSEALEDRENLLG